MPPIKSKNKVRVVHQSISNLKSKGKSYHDYWILEFEHTPTNRERLTIHVGDTIALACSDSKLGNFANKGWHPFDQKWSAAQVLALYFTDDCEYRMTVRWFYRCDKAEVSRITSIWERNKFIFPPKNLHFRSVIESATIDEVDMEDVLGRVVLTSQEKGFKHGFSRHHTFKNLTPVPQVALLCQGHYDFTTRIFQNIQDWNGDATLAASYDISVPFMERGLPCLEEDSTTMMEQYMINVPKRQSIAEQAANLLKTNNNNNNNNNNKKRGPASSNIGPSKRAKTGANAAAAAAAATTSKKNQSKKNMERDSDDNSDDDSKAFIEFLQDPIHMDKAGAEYYYQIRLETTGRVFQVGDLVALEWEYSNDFSSKPHKSKSFNSKWKPFDRQWAAAQILSFQRPRHPDSSPQMQIKWFYQFQDLDKDMKRLVLQHIKKPSDSHVFETKEADLFPVSSILGVIDMVPPNQKVTKIKSSSSNAHSSTPSSTQLPQAELTCRHRIEKDNVVKTHDWDNYDSNSLNDALERGLKCIHHILRAKTIAAIERSPSDSDKSDDENDCESDESSETEQFQVAAPTVVASQLAKTNETGHRFFASVSVPVHHGKCAPRFVTKTRCTQWKLRIGDVVCLEKEGAEPPVPARRPARATLGLWHPFQVPWTCCQILSIYTTTDAEDDVLVEVRWFPRASGIQISALEGLQRMKMQPNDDEVFESFSIASDISAANILGRVNLTLGHHKQSGDPKSEGRSTIPTVDRQCKRLYFERVGKIQGMFCGKIGPTAWNDRLVERGLEASKFLQLDEELRGFIDSFRGFDKINLDSDMSALQQEHITAGNSLIDEGSKVWSDGTSELHLQASIQPPFHRYVEADNICHKDDRSRQLWTITVGDIVAAEKKEGGRSFPYTSNWAPCQIASIMKTQEQLAFEVRWLVHATDLDESSLDCVYESHQCVMADLNQDHLLGPLTLLLNSTNTKASPPFLPLTLQRYGGFRETKASNGSPDSLTFEAMVERTISSCKRFKSQTSKQHVLVKVLELQSSHDPDPHLASMEAASPASRSSAPDDRTCAMNTIAAFTSEHFPVDENGSQGAAIARTQELSGALHSQDDPSPENSAASSMSSILYSGRHISTTKTPVHTDKSTLRAYFTEMQIEPQFDLFTVQGKKGDKPWKIKLGDIVAVRYQHGAGRTKFDDNAIQGGKHEPYLVAWAVAEIVAIWRKYETMKGLAEATRRTSNKNMRITGDLELEIRWFWRKCELPGGSAKKEASDSHEEIFETDNIDRCTATSILAPTRVVNSLNEMNAVPLFHVGIPMVQFLCYRFWSLHRRSIVPCGSVMKRLARSRMYSTCFAKDNFLRGKLEKIERKEEEEALVVGHSEPSADSPTPAWKEAFDKVIDKVSLSESSENVFDHRFTMIGRQTEQDSISNFLRTSINAAHETSTDGTECPSMFVAGPPGTGKSVSVCSIVGKLRLEQTQGKLPDFDFISLNGMEMRHPFEAYVKFWEAISGNAKERLSPELAASKLERYFTGMPIHEAPERSVVVLLLDEIDFLMTGKQTVVYNFFDWPKRSFEISNSPRLIVIGISNTVDFPTRLKPSVRSRLGSSRCDFKAYNSEGIMDILKSKIQPKTSSYPVFDKDAIVFAARKIGSLTGDIRQAMQMCKTAAETVMQEVENGTRNDPKSTPGRPMVRIKDLQRVFRDKNGNILSQAIASSAPLEALLLIAIATLGESTQDIGEVMTKTDSIANSSGIPEYNPPPSFQEMLDMLNRLAEARLVRLRTERSSKTTFHASQGGSGGAWPSITLNVDAHDILSALRPTIHSQLAEKYLSTGI